MLVIGLACASPAQERKDNLTLSGDNITVTSLEGMRYPPLARTAPGVPKTSS